MEGHTESVSCSTVLSKEEVATAGMDNTLRIWDLNKMAESNTLSGVKAFFDIDYSKHSNLIASGSSDRHVRLWDPRTTTGKVRLMLYKTIFTKLVLSFFILTYRFLRNHLPLILFGSQQCGGIQTTRISC